MHLTSVVVIIGFVVACCCGKDTTYTVIVYTGRSWTAGTDATVKLRLVDENGFPSRLSVLHHAGDTFEANSVDSFALSIAHMPRLCAVRVWKINRGLFSDWQLDKIVVFDNVTGAVYSFPFYTWVERTEVSRLTVHGGWGSWGAWKYCDGRSCARPHAYRLRRCDAPSPACSGRPCEGTSRENVEGELKKGQEATAAPTTEILSETADTDAGRIISHHNHVLVPSNDTRDVMPRRIATTPADLGRNAIGVLDFHRLLISKYRQDTVTVKPLKRITSTSVYKHDSQGPETIHRYVSNVTTPQYDTTYTEGEMIHMQAQPAPPIEYGDTVPYNKASRYRGNTENHTTFDISNEEVDLRNISDISEMTGRPSFVSNTYDTDASSVAVMDTSTGRTGDYTPASSNRLLVTAAPSGYTTVLQSTLSSQPDENSKIYDKFDFSTKSMKIFSTMTITDNQQNVGNVDQSFDNRIPSRNISKLLSDNATNISSNNSTKNTSNNTRRWNSTTYIWSNATTRIPSNNMSRIPYNNTLKILYNNTSKIPYNNTSKIPYSSTSKIPYNNTSKIRSNNTMAVLVRNTTGNLSHILRVFPNHTQTKSLQAMIDIAEPTLNRVTMLFPSQVVRSLGFHATIDQEATNMAEKTLKRFTPTSSGELLQPTAVLSTPNLSEWNEIKPSHTIRIAYSLSTTLIETVIPSTPQPSMPQDSIATPDNGIQIVQTASKITAKSSLDVTDVYTVMTFVPTVTSQQSLDSAPPSSRYPYDSFFMLNRGTTSRTLRQSRTQELFHKRETPSYVVEKKTLGSRIDQVAVLVNEPSAQPYKSIHRKSARHRNNFKNNPPGHGVKVGTQRALPESTLQTAFFGPFSSVYLVAAISVSSALAILILVSFILYIYATQIKPTYYHIKHARHQIDGGSTHVDAINAYGSWRRIVPQQVV